MLGSGVLGGVDLAGIHKVLGPDLDQAFTELLGIVACQVPRRAQLFGQNSPGKRHGRLDIRTNRVSTGRRIGS
jgi:hypothetical protein